MKKYHYKIMLIDKHFVEIDTNENLIDLMNVNGEKDLVVNESDDGIRRLVKCSSIVFIEEIKNK